MKGACLSKLHYMVNDQPLRIATLTDLGSIFLLELITPWNRL